MLALFSNYWIDQWARSLVGHFQPGSFLEWSFVRETWRTMFATELVPGTVFLVMAFFLPESPRWRRRRRP
jgi:hypothetical protein